MAAPKELQNLVDIFDRNIEDYKSGRFNEAQVRQQFLDPFFEILGWDVANKQGWSEAYKEVVHEDSLKIAGKYKAPDYGFRIGRERKFFVEAKKPSVDVKNDPAPAYQVRRYAWSAKLPLSIVTDFEEFAVYDCRVKPARNDKSSAARVKYLRYTDYADEWDFIEGLFSKDAILKGAFDKYAESHKAKRGTAEVDDAFLDEIEIWREILAKNLCKKNPDLGPRDLNYAVQATIDRVIFLRICEDRGIEPYGRLEILQNGANVYGRLFDQFREADQRYNSGLFHFRNERGRTTAADRLTPMLKLDDKPLKQMMKGLYFPDCPYEFSMLSADILGQIYERFLGNVITITGRRVKIEQKPEVRKAGGVYYTPTYIVNYIVENTVGKLLENKTARQAASIKILDPACGSGSFLIGAYQYLLDWYLGWYLDHGPSKHKKAVFKVPPKKKGDEPSWHLTLAERKHILLNNIHGVDIDSQAVEVTKLSLLLKVLEDREAIPRQQELAVFKQRLLPDLDENIRCGNSLIESDFYDQGQLDLTEEDHYRINVFDWDRSSGFPQIMRRGGFDAVIGNPPYDVVEKDRKKASWPHDLLREYVSRQDVLAPALGGKLNLFRMFIVKGSTLLRKNGLFSMIIPLALLGDISCARTRRFLIESFSNFKADCFPQKDNAKNRVFLSAKISTAIIAFSKRAPRRNEVIRVRVYPGRSFGDPHRNNVVRPRDLRLIDPSNSPIPLVDEANWLICRSIYRNSTVCRLGDFVGCSITRGEINQTIYRDYVTDDQSCSRLVKGVEIGRYRIHETLSQGQREWFDERRFLRDNNERQIINRRRIATQRITGIDEQWRVVAAIIEPRAYFSDSTNSVFLNADSHYDLNYVLALLNSRLLQWHFKITSTNNNVGTNELKNLPFRTIDFSDTQDRYLYERVLVQARTMTELCSSAPSAGPHQRQIRERRVDTTDRDIDALVYRLYGLTPDQIQIIAEG